jgi:putative heme iron utilization protein
MQAAAELREKLSANPGVVFEDAAREHNVPPRAIVEALPDAMRRLAPGAASSMQWTIFPAGAT